PVTEMCLNDRRRDETDHAGLEPADRRRGVEDAAPTWSDHEPRVRVGDAWLTAVVAGITAFAGLAGSFIGASLQARAARDTASRQAAASAATGRSEMRKAAVTHRAAHGGSPWSPPNAAGQARPTTTLPRARPSPTRANASGTSSRVKVRSIWMV